MAEQSQQILEITDASGALDMELSLSEGPEANMETSALQVDSGIDELSLEMPLDKKAEMLHELNRLGIVDDSALTQQEDIARAARQLPIVIDYGLVSRYNIETLEQPRKDRFWESPILETMRQELKTVSTLMRESIEADETEPTWGAVSVRLLETAVVEEGEKRGNYLKAGLASSALATEQERRNFLAKLYQEGVAPETAEACKSSLIIFMDESLDANPDWTPRLTPISGWSKMFQVSTKGALDYLDHTTLRPAVEADAPSAKRLQANVVEQTMAGGVDAKTHDQSISASLDDDKVYGNVLDPFKVERFGLQQVYIAELRARLLEGPDWDNTRLAKDLHEKQKEHDGEIINYVEDRKTSEEENFGSHLTAVERLSTDLAAVFKTVSTEVQQEFDPTGTPVEDLTYQQRAGQRFKAVVGEVEAYKAIALYLDPVTSKRRLNEEFAVGTISSGDEIWTISEEGAAAPDAMKRLIDGILYAAYRPDAPLEVGAEELRDMAHNWRRRLLGIATQNISEIEPYFDTDQQKVALSRDEVGTLRLDDKIMPHPKGALEQYAGRTLGCPALREVQVDRRLLADTDKQLYGSANFVDHVMAATINEAYDRGIFNVSPDRARSNIAMQ